MDDDARRRRRIDGAGELGERGADEGRFARHAGRAVAPHLREHAPAGRREGLRGGEPEAAVRAENEDGALGCVAGGHRPSSGCRDERESALVAGDAQGRCSAARFGRGIGRTLS